MNKRGFTLIELLAVITLLGITAIITVAVIINVVNNAKRDAFKDSVFAAINAYTNKESSEHFNDLGEINITDLPLDNNHFTSGTVKRNDNNEVIVINVTDGSFCGNGSKKTLTVTEGNCN